MTSKYMMARAFQHKVFRFERKEFSPGDPTMYDLCYVERRVGSPYVGFWWVGGFVFGIGFFNVYFPEADTRKATEAEKDTLCRGWVRSTFADSYKLEREHFA